jgi:hypothetical protein
MDRSTGRLSLASDIQSVARLGNDAASKTLEGPAASLSGGGHSGCDAETRDLPTPHQLLTSKGADMAERTRTPGRSDSGTPASAVKITPAVYSSGPVTTTHTIA